MQLVHYYILQIGFDHIYNFLLTFLQDITLLKPKDIGGVKHIFRYLRSTTDVGMFYSTKSYFSLIGYADADYLLNPHKVKSQIYYLFTRGILLYHGSRQCKH